MTDAFCRCRVPQDNASGARGGWYFVAPSGQVLRSRPEVRLYLLGSDGILKGAASAPAGSAPTSDASMPREGADAALTGRPGVARRAASLAVPGTGTGSSGGAASAPAAASSAPAPAPAETADAPAGAATTDAAQPAVSRKRPPAHCMRLTADAAVSAGQQVVALDVRNVWCEAKIVRVRHKGHQKGSEPIQVAAVRLRFAGTLAPAPMVSGRCCHSAHANRSMRFPWWLAGWGPEWDEWVSLDSGKIAMPDDQYVARPDPTLTARAKAMAKQQRETVKAEAAEAADPASPHEEGVSDAPEVVAHPGPVKKRKMGPGLDDQAAPSNDAAGAMSWEAARLAAQEAEVCEAEKLCPSPPAHLHPLVAMSTAWHVCITPLRRLRVGGRPKQCHPRSASRMTRSSLAAAAATRRRQH